MKRQRKGPMFVGSLQVELLIHDACSLKDKRRVVRSVRDRLHREQQVSVAEVGLLDRMDAALLGVAVASGSEQRAHTILDKTIEKLRMLHDAELGEHQRVIRKADAMDLACEHETPLITDDERNAWGVGEAVDAAREGQR